MFFPSSVLICLAAHLVGRAMALPMQVDTGKGLLSRRSEIDLELQGRAVDLSLSDDLFSRDVRQTVAVAFKMDAASRAKRKANRLQKKVNYATGDIDRAHSEHEKARVAHLEKSKTEQDAEKARHFEVAAKLHGEKQADLVKMRQTLLAQHNTKNPSLRDTLAYADWRARVEKESAQASQAAALWNKDPSKWGPTELYTDKAKAEYKLPKARFKGFIA